MTRRRRKAVGISAIVAVSAVTAASCGDGVPDSARSWEADASLVTDYLTEVWSDDVFEATDLQFLPDGRAIVISKGGWEGAGEGAVTLLDRDGSTVRELLRVPVCADAERGLLGLEIDPAFDENRLIYVYYTRQMSGCALTDPQTVDVIERPVWNRVSSYVFDERGIDPASERVLVDEIPGHQSSHQAGGLEFLADDTLLISTGEAMIRQSRDLDVIAGKLLRIDVRQGGTAPSDNPYRDRDDPVAALVFASGFRNPFRIAADPWGSTIVAADVGTDEFEEINVVGAGEDFGYPTVEGPQRAGGATAPTLWYRHVDGCSSVIGGSFVPASFIRDGDRSYYTFSDLTCTGIWAVSFEGRNVERAVKLIDELATYPATLRWGPEDSLYIVNIGPGAQPITRLARTDQT